MNWIIVKDKKGKVFLLADWKKFMIKENNLKLVDFIELPKEVKRYTEMNVLEQIKNNKYKIVIANNEIRKRKRIILFFEKILDKVK